MAVRSQAPARVRPRPGARPGADRRCGGGAARRHAGVVAVAQRICAAQPDPPRSGHTVRLVGARTPRGGPHRPRRLQQPGRRPGDLGLRAAGQLARGVPPVRRLPPPAAPDAGYRAGRGRPGLVFRQRRRAAALRRPGAGPDPVLLAVRRHGRGDPGARGDLQDGVPPGGRGRDPPADRAGGGWLTLVRELRGRAKPGPEPEKAPGESPADWPQLRAAGGTRPPTGWWRTSGPGG